MFLKNRKRIAALEVITEAILFRKQPSFIEGLATMAWELGLITNKELSKFITEANE
jgi:hypothetical protein